MNDLHALLRQRTDAAHRRLEGRPFFAALAAKSLPLEAFVTYLRALAILHAVVERSFARAASEPLQALWRPELARLPALLADVEHLSGGDRRHVSNAVKEALTLAREAAELAARDPVALIGDLYVLEGSQNGAPIVRAMVVACYGERAAACRYLRDDPRGARQDWSAFLARMEALRLSRGEQDRIAARAARVFGGLETVVAALFPQRRDERLFLATALNPEAGDHAVPQDPREIAALLAAGNEAWSLWPYLEARYGERGRRYTASDSGWLATLPRGGVPAMRRSVRWLRGVLASRGLPSIILEQHLRALARELGSALPEREAELAGMVTVADELASERDALPSPLPALALTTPIAGEEAATLLASAWCDERAGVKGAVAAVRDWLVTQAPAAEPAVKAFLATLSET